MSADLWREFGSPDQELPTNTILQTRKSEFEVSAGLLSMQVPEPNKRSSSDAGSTSDACGYPNNLPKSMKSVHGLLPARPLLPSEYSITDTALAIDKSSEPTRREVDSFGAVLTTSAYSHTSEEKTTPRQIDPPTLDEDDEWGDFVEASKPESADSTAVRSRNARKSNSKHEVPAPVPPNPTFGQPLLSGEENITTETTAVDSTTSGPQPLMRAPVQGPSPSNIPPPSILLLLISSVFQSLSNDFKNCNLQASPILQTFGPGEHKFITNLRRNLAIIRASARIIAGRKLRWSRDAHLSQSMKIGPAQGGRAGGMKLTVLDRAETRREDREVEEAIRTWKQQVGSLRALLIAIRTQESDLTLAIPELAEKMPIRLAKLSEGGITAAKSCFLCGLKRDERVEKVDMQVEDSFGEWWIDHWGHLDCVVFWEEQKDHLQRR